MLEEQKLILSNILEKKGFSHDFLLIGDGSGSKVEQPSASFVTILNNNFEVVNQILSYTSIGTNNFAELHPYVLALYYIGCDPTNTNKKIVIISDSEITVQCGNKQYERKANLFLWRSIEHYENIFDIKWIWQPRNSNYYLEKADTESKRFRKIDKGVSS